MKKTILFLGITTAIIFSACKKDNNDSNNTPSNYIATFKTTIYNVSDMPADTIKDDYLNLPNPQNPFLTFTFYSLENNTIVPNTDSATTKWDLAFSGNKIRVNNVTSGPGIGGAFVYNGTFTELLGVPKDSTFKVDNYPSTYAITKASDASWYHLDSDGQGGGSNLITPIPGRILVIKTATGKYAKVEILNYYKGGVTPDANASNTVKADLQRFYTFKYCLSN